MLAETLAPESPQDNMRRYRKPTGSWWLVNALESAIDLWDLLHSAKMVVQHYKPAALSPMQNK